MAPSPFRRQLHNFFESVTSEAAVVAEIVSHQVNGIVGFALEQRLVLRFYRTEAAEYLFLYPYVFNMRRQVIRREGTCASENHHRLSKLTILREFHRALHQQPHFNRRQRVQAATSI